MALCIAKGQKKGRPEPADWLAAAVIGLEHTAGEPTECGEPRWSTNPSARSTGASLMPSSFSSVGW